MVSYQANKSENYEILQMGPEPEPEEGREILKESKGRTQDDRQSDT